MIDQNKQDASSSFFISVIIPCRNEEKMIARCLDSLLEQTYPKDKLEILIIDGASEDRTKEIVKKYSQTHHFIKVVDNPKKITPIALNLGIKNSLGNRIVFMGAHAYYDKDYIAGCIKNMEKYGADCVGGITKVRFYKNTLIAKAITLSLFSLFGSGDAFYKTGRAAEPVETDTVFGGCYKKELFDKIGLFNEKLVRSQDMEFSLRLKKAGGKILLCPDIAAYYYPKTTLGEFFKHNFEDGVWAVYPLKFKVSLFKIRHLLPLFFVSAIIILGAMSFFWKFSLYAFLFIIFLYFLLSLSFSFLIAIREKDLKIFPFAVMAFFCRHFGYGLGSLAGMIKLI